ncbi:unnamed protein product [Ambrosiozyma monospora]|uniref:Unnamed protein product n=1 Tax=Ambrosiozyma monospora TaxID=43982 RepID=A0A9W6STY5_AMBMO|nr:unnamed protein product [Ambrosiozyma monospora]
MKDFKEFLNNRDNIIDKGVENPSQYWKERFESKTWADGTPCRFARLALVLQSVVPNSMASERTFSTMGWFNSVLRSRLTGENITNLTIVKFAYRYDSKLNTNRAKIKETIWARDHFNSDFADSGDSGDSAGSTGSSGSSGSSGSGSDGGSGGSCFDGGSSGSVGSAGDDAIDVCLGTSLNDENFTGESNMFGSDIGGRVW